MSLEVEMYRKFANDCIDRAQSARDGDTAAGMIRLAQFWLAKSDEIDRSPVSSAPTNTNWVAQLSDPVQHPR